MPRTIGPERDHFGGEDGLCTEICNGQYNYYWKCMHCSFRLGGKNFPNAKERIHLSGDPSLRNGLISIVCSNAPDAVKTQFGLLVRTKRLEKEHRLKKRKRRDELLRSNKTAISPLKQSRLAVTPPSLADDVVDDAWGEAFFGLDISVNKIQQPLFREAITATQRSKIGFVLNYY